ncbi:MAG: molybdopterin-dependent oxidoreductase [Chloroflexi bacterium]|nr:molybdopterin-dependent oxidoreductase [Chloroflexota bacterium]
MYHPDRLKYPLKRVGKRGEGKWQQVSWDEALDQAAKAFQNVKEKYGAESVAMIHGGSKGYRDSYLARLANLFGTPNISWQGHVCAIPNSIAGQMTYGAGLGVDYDYPPACIVIWAGNPSETSFNGYPKLIDAMKRGTKIIVIDPRATLLTPKAEMWLKVRPGSDLALALGMINVIINENLYDKDFVKDWTVGFSELKKHVKAYSPEKVSEITWIDADTIRKAARFYATNKPACILGGNGLEHNLNSFQAARAISILRAITGNIGIPGGHLQLAHGTDLLNRKGPELEFWDRLPKEQLQKKVDAKYKYIPEYLPMARRVPPESIMKAIIDEDPYPVKAVYMAACNSLLTHANAQYVFKALNKLDFLLVSDLFMTPTAALADLVLPVSSFLEHNDIDQLGDKIVPQLKVAQIGECRSDYGIISGLARKLGLGEHFWNTEEECLDAILAPSHITFEELKKVSISRSEHQYRKYLNNGFSTPSHKVELYSSRLKEWGFDPLPVYYEPQETPLSDPELAKEYPLVFTTWKSGIFRHSRLRQIKSLRLKRPDPVINIHKETAGKLGIKDGDWVYIENKRGRIKQKAVLSSEIDPRVVIVDYG